MDIAEAGQITTFAINNRRRTLADNVRNHNPLLANIEEKAADGTSGGIYLTEPIVYDENHSFQFFHGMQPFDLQRNDKYKMAQFPWRECCIAVVMSQRDLAIVTGEAKFIDLLETELTNSETTFKNQMAWSVMGNGMNYQGQDITGIQALISSTGKGTVGTINSEQDTWWRNKVYDMSLNGQRMSVNGLVAATNWMCTALTRNDEYPNIVVCSRKTWNLYQQMQQAHQYYSNADTARVGFKSIKWRDLDIFFDDTCPENNIYFINTKYIKYRPHSDVNMKQLEQREPIDQNAFVRVMVWMGNLTMSNRFMQGVVVGS